MLLTAYRFAEFIGMVCLILTGWSGLLAVSDSFHVFVDIPLEVTLITALSVLRVSVVETTLCAEETSRYCFSADSEQELDRSSRERGLPPQKLTRVLNYIHAHLDKPLSLKTIAKVIDISPSHFLTLFKQSTGLSPHQYVITQRVEKAKLLLRQTDLPIAEIADQTGFADQSHLTRMIRRYTGRTPKMLRDDRSNQN